MYSGLLTPSPDEVRHLWRVANGDESPSMAIVGGLVFNSYFKQFMKYDILIYKQWIAAIIPHMHRSLHDVNIVEAYNNFVLPGFIDGHIHIESTLLNPIEFAFAAAKAGVTTVFTDFHEVGCIFDAKKFLLFLKQLPSLLPCKIFAFMPFCFVSNAYSIINKYKFIGIFEFMPEYLSQRNLQSDELVALLQQIKIEGHLFGITDVSVLNACHAIGIRSDHEVRTVEQIEERLKTGFFVMLRSGTLAKEGDKLLRECVKRGFPLDRMCLVTDDILARDMDTDYMLKKLHSAIAQGVQLGEAINMLSFNIARHYGFGELIGVIKPGAYADLLVVDGELSNINAVICGGKLLSDWRNSFKQEIHYPKTILQQNITRGKLNYDDLLAIIPSKIFEMQKLKVKAIEWNEKTRFTNLVEKEIMLNKAGEILANDVCWLFALDRHNPKAMGFGFLTGFGLSTGAIATSISHDEHNIIAVGKSLNDILVAINRVIQLQGGIVVVKQNSVIEEIPLSLGGLMSLDKFENVKQRLWNMHLALRELGVNWNDPIFPLFWLGMKVAPRYRITPQGVWDVFEQNFVSPF